MAYPGSGYNGSYNHNGGYQQYQQGPYQQGPYQQPYQQPYQGQQGYGPPPPPQQYDHRGQGGPPPPPQGSQSFGVQGMDFQYSDLHGKKKALLIGINYIGSNNALRGCINDVHNMIQWLIQNYGFKRDDMVVLTDDQNQPRAIPTRQNILDAMGWLVSGARPGDNLFLHYSGHGGRTEDLDGDEEDGYDECIYPVDFQQTNPGHIIDDILHDICVKSLPAGCRLTAIFDCCHSGSILDLPYMYSTKGVLKEPNLLKDAGQGILGIGQAYLRNDIGGILTGASGLFSRVTRTTGGDQERVKQMKTAPADVICFTGCKDTQTSADASISGQGQGAMSWAFREALNKYQGNLSYLSLLNAVRQEMLDGGYEQKPQLSACHPIDLNLKFTL
ncbi:hypothetical protein R6Q59_009972 [Mikania micrantha]